MKDCIKIEELKMFLESELQVTLVNDVCKKHLTLTTIDVVDDCCGLYDDYLLYSEFYSINGIKPLVKPLSELTQKEADTLGDCLDMDYIELLDNGQNNELSYNIGKMIGGNLIVNELAKRHYDIFNWIGRGLANKLED